MVRAPLIPWFGSIGGAPADREVPPSPPPGSEGPVTTDPAAEARARAFQLAFGAVAPMLDPVGGLGLIGIMKLLGLLDHGKLLGSERPWSSRSPSPQSSPWGEPPAQPSPVPSPAPAPPATPAPATTAPAPTTTAPAPATTAPAPASKPGATAPPPGSQINKRLADWYKDPANYDRVARQFGTTRNMCASYATMALEKSGALVIPRDTTYPGYDDDGRPKSVRAWAPSLARWLEEKKGWKRVTKMSDFKPGDLLFTNGREGTYNHVMVFDSWVDRSRGIARVTDNQGHRGVRNLHERSPVSYGLRAP